MSVSLSGGALWLAAKAPRLTTMVARAWCATAIRGSRPPHWLLARLNEQLKFEVQKKVRLTTGDVLYVDPFDEIGREILREGSFEPETVLIFDAILRPGMVVIDAGANIGHYSVIASRLVGAGGRVHAFEPAPGTFDKLQRNLKLNHCTNVVSTRCALSSEAGEAALHLGVSPGTNSLRATVHAAGGTLNVPVSTLDSYVRTAAITRLDLLKIDVEGAELPLLQGAADTVAALQPIILVEFSVHTLPFGYGTKDLANRLEGWNYRLYRTSQVPLVPYMAGNSEPIFFNVLAVPDHAQASLVSSRILAK